jgi:iron complex outermembrane receptor protein
MKITKELLTVVMVFLLSYQPLFAQKQTISGKITDSKGIPIEGASVKIKSTKAGTSTEKDGSFTLQALPTDFLEIMSVGFKTRVVPANSKSFNFSLEAISVDLQEVVLVGSRKGGRVKTESPVPVDIINLNQAGTPTAKMDLTSVLNYAAPSFNYNKQSGADGADHIDLGTLRGLGPDQTLVLINGKRRHQTAFVALFGTRGRGNSGADLNAFPQESVDRIEILRDGASAQYGSDAMAGVINIILKKDINHWNINTGWSGYYDHKFNPLNSFDPTQYYTGHQIDGGTFSFSANNGLAIGKKGGFINISASFLNQAKTFRQVPDTNVWTNPNALPLNTSRRAFGDGSVTTAGTMYNMEIPLNSKTTFYSFGGYNYKGSDAFAYTRNWSARPDRFPVDNNGNIIFVADIMKKSSDGETFYNPHIQTHITDVSLAAGIRGTTGNEWSWDLSNTLGRNDFHYFGDKTFNASNIGNISQTHFDDGGFNFLQNTLNFDLNKSFKSIAEGLNLGFGAEYRYEKYGIYKGEEASYKAYSNTLGQAPGAQGFPGFSPADEVAANRSNIGLYADAELNATKAWLLDGAVRLENYTDFGSVATLKVATRYKLSDNFNLRGSVSTGYRAPSLQQIYFSNTLTSFSGGQLVQSRIAANGSVLANAAGIQKLKQETSTNASIGFSWKAAKTLTFTVDGYMVKVKDRMVLSGLFDASLSPTFAAQLNALGVTTAQFFANAVNTTTYGLDMVADYTKKWHNKSLKVLIAGNIQNMNIDAVHVPTLLDDSYAHRKNFFSDREEAFLKASAPKAKFTFNLDYTVGKLGLGTHITYFGDVKLLGFGWTGLASAAGTGGPGDPAISGSFTGIDPYVDIDGYNDQVHVAKEIFDFKPRVTTDIYTSYKLCKAATVFLGADNLFNVHPALGAVPNARYEAMDNESGGPWDSVQMGFNGLRLFGKLVLNF